MTECRPRTRLRRASATLLRPRKLSCRLSCLPSSASSCSISSALAELAQLRATASTLEPTAASTPGSPDAPGSSTGHLPSSSSRSSEPETAASRAGSASRSRWFRARAAPCSPTVVPTWFAAAAGAAAIGFCSRAGRNARAHPAVLELTAERAAVAHPQRLLSRLRQASPHGSRRAPRRHAQTLRLHSSGFRAMCKTA